MQWQGSFLMEFTSALGVSLATGFLALHFAVGAVARDATWGWPLQKQIIAWSSLVFYAACYPPGVVLILFGTALAWGFGRIVDSGRAPSCWMLALFVLSALSILFVFKYYNFFLDVARLPAGFPRLSLILPVGISFYTFTIVGYLVDLHQRKVMPVRGFHEALILVAFWPHLAAGPILRSGNMVGSMRQRAIREPSDWMLASLLIFGGAAKKLLIADNIGAYVNKNLESGIETMSGVDALATLLGFSAQIYVDFSGYSDMAIGFALLLGFRLPANFNYPYRATTVTEFWRRWHISLSNWFRDYVFIPLGGSRRGTARVFVNLLIVFLVSGLWHGAGYGFLIWGAIHGLAVGFERLAGSRYRAVPAALRWFATMAVVVLAWAFFRLEWQQALLLVARVLQPSSYLGYTVDSVFFVLPILGFLFFTVIDHVVRYYRVGPDGYPALPERRLTFAAGYVAVVYALSLVLAGRPLPFIYFNF